ncbi:cell wall-binding repeat-containing protein [Acidimicrobiia bacterium EGI L10123]|uniref:cell wall-binding repeat-containing protein n=1 Tax=Salinilacustrithrix flava TaxID=2957203 RepID=UPI003D7C170E|nr:cell wall-binding repeat-containing protein [Acidimicrobiia bacterium EGI L10123]
MTSTRSLHRAGVVLATAMLVLTSAIGAAGAQETPQLSADRYGTAARAALDAFPDGADVAVLASGEDFADALAAAPLAAAYDAPILLSARDVLPDSTRDTLAYLGVADVLVMGGPDAVSHDVTNSLHVDYQVSRVAGDDRYATAARAALDAFPGGTNVAVLASGEDFPDALAAAPLAAVYDAPILLTGRDQMPDVTRDLLAELNVADVLVMGGPDAVSHDVTNSLHVDYQVSRVAGADRYETAVTASLDWTDGANVVVLASGEDFPDALAAAPLAAFFDAPILLTGRDALPDVTRDRLAELNVADVLVMGGPEAVSNEVTNSLHVDYQVSRVAG